MIRSYIRAAFKAATLATLSLPALAHDGHSHSNHPAATNSVVVGELEISGAFTRATLPGQPVGGGYLTILNTGNVDDTLIGGSATFAGHVEIHEMAVVNDVMNMRELAGGLVIPAGETVSLQPGGYHLMFIQLDQALVAGETVNVSLTFENAGTVEIAFDVVPAGARPTDGDHGHSGHDAGEHGDCAHGAH